MEGGKGRGGMTILLLCLGMMAGVASAGGDHPAGVSVRIDVAPGPYHVGQGIVLEVKGDGDGSEPVIEVPKLDQGRLVPLAPHPGTRPGDPAAGWARRFVLVPSHAGELKVRPFRVRDAAGRVLGTKLTQLTVRPIPQAGRSASFLGGVGPCRVAAAVTPTRARVGQEVEFRITLQGPGAWGSVLAPDLKAWSGFSPGLEVQPIGNRFEPGQPPSRVFVYRLRPRSAGSMILPPVAVTTFDPAPGRFETRATTGVGLTVSPPPRFDPTTIEFSPSPREIPPRRAPWLVLAAGATLIAGGMIAAGLRNRRAKRPVSWEREARDLERWWAKDRREPGLGTEIHDRLTRGLSREVGRPIAVLTPADAIRAVATVGDDPALATRVGTLVTRLDRLRFDEATPGGSNLVEADALVIEAVEIYKAIGRSVRPSRPDRPSSPHPQGWDAG